MVVSDLFIDSYRLLSSSLDSLGKTLVVNSQKTLNWTLNEFKYLTSTCWDKEYQPITIDMTKDNNTGRSRLTSNSLFDPNSSPFQITKWVFLLM